MHSTNQYISSHLTVVVAAAVMDVKEYLSVVVYNIDNAGKLVDRYAGKKCEVRCSYDPAGLSVRIIVPGKLLARGKVLA